MKIQMDDYYVFCQVAKYGSMKQASEKMQLPLSTISRRIVSLEEKLELQLFIRNKNKLSLSKAGTKYFDKLSPIITNLATSIDELNDKSGQLSGHVVISSTNVYYSNFIHPQLIGFLKSNPKVTIEHKFATNANTLTDDVDIAVVIGKLPESNLIARKLNTLNALFLASKDFAKQYEKEILDGEFNSIPYIATLYHPAITARNLTSNEIVTVNPPKILTVMDVLMLIESTKAGVGYSVIPSYATENLNFDEDFVTIFKDFELMPITFSLLYRNKKLQSAAQRAVIDLIMNTFK